MNNKAIKKIDPKLIRSVSIKSNSMLEVIIFVDDYNEMSEIFYKNDVEVIRYLPFIKSFIIKAPMDTIYMLAALNKVKYICSDIETNTQINIANKVIGADKLRNKGLSGKGIGIAIIDTGIYPHIDFVKPKYKIKKFVDILGGRSTPYDDNGHGTFVSGVAAGSGYASKGKYKGIAPKANIISLKAINKNGGGNASDILEAMQYVWDHYKELNIKVVVLSLGAVAGSKPIDVLSQGAQELWNKGLFVVAAAGNSGPSRNSITTPGINPNILTVGASDDKRTITISDDCVAKFSSRGEVGKVMKPDVVAPGVDIISTNNRKIPTYTKMSGTSVATPIVAGAAALYYEGIKNASPDKIKAIIMRDAVSLGESKYAQGKGIVMLM